MENRFGIKDLFLFVLIAALIGVVIMAMWQFDRQYKEVLTIKQQNVETAREINGIKRQLAQGVVAVGAGNTGSNRSTTQPIDDAFTPIRAAEAAPNFARGDWHIDNFGTKVGRLTPMVSTDVYQRWVEFQVLESLAVRDPNTLEYKPRLAERWELQADGLKSTFWLRKGVTFSDGTPLTADDIIFTFDWMMNPEVDAERTRSYFKRTFAGVKKLDDYTVEFTFKEPYFLSFEQVSSLGIMPKHFYSKYTPQQFNEKTGLLMGSGPYRLETPDSWTPGQRVILYRNDRYWGEAPTFDRLIFHEIQGESTQMVLYGNQEHDVLRCTAPMFDKITKDQRVMEFSNSFEFESIFGGYLYIAWNQEKLVDGKGQVTRFADPRVRRAMTMMLDRERMAKEIFLGYATVASGPFLPSNPQSDATVKPWPYDPAAAKELLREAGFYDRDNDGVIDGPDGTPFKFTFTYPSGSDTWEKVVLFAKDSYSAAGIVMEPERIDWPVLVKRLDTSDFEAVTLGWSSVVESDPYQTFHSESIANQGDNRTSYRNPELDKTIDTARVMIERDGRMKLWNKVHRTLHEDQPYTFLFNRKALRLIHKRVQNVEKSRMGLNYEHLNGGMIPWFVPETQQRYQQ